METISRTYVFYIFVDVFTFIFLFIYFYFYFKILIKHNFIMNKKNLFLEMASSIPYTFVS
jgi:hypothetical protein